MICKERVYQTVQSDPGLICKEYAKILNARPGDVREALKSLHYFGRIYSGLNRDNNNYKWYIQGQGPHSIAGKLVSRAWKGNIVLGKRVAGQVTQKI